MTRRSAQRVRSRTLLICLGTATTVACSTLVGASSIESRPSEKPRIVEWAAQDPVFQAPARVPERIGVNYHAMWTEQSESVRSKLLDQYAAAGVKWVRIDLAWDTLQPDAPVGDDPGYDMAGGVAAVDQRLNEVEARGMKAVVMLYWPPGWAAVGGKTSKAGRPKDGATFGRVLGWAAQRWRTQAPVWEMWNEPDQDAFWSSQDPVEYAKMIRAAYPIAKAASPTTTFLLGAPTYLGLAKRWHARMYSVDGFAGSYDAIAVHPYMGRADARPEATDSAIRSWSIAGLADLKVLLDAHGDGQTPIWVTEFGWSAHGNVGGEPTWKRGVNENAQAEYLLRAMSMFGEQGVVAALAYTDRDTATGDIHEDRFGLVRRDISPKRAYFALRCAAIRVCGPESEAVVLP